MNKWHWDYEEGANPPYYHIYSDDGAVETFDIAQSDDADNVIGAICSFVNSLKIVEKTDKFIWEVRNGQSKNT